MGRLVRPAAADRDGSSKPPFDSFAIGGRYPTSLARAARSAPAPLNRRLTRFLSVGR